MRDITPVIAERFVRENPSRFASLKAMFADAQRDHVIDSNPFQNARKPRQDGRKHIIPLTRQEVETLARIAGELFGGYGQDVYGPLITLAAWTGARPAELFGLEWRDVDGDTLHIRRQWVSGELKPHTKGYSKRRVPLSSQALEALARVPHIEGQPYVFFTNTTRARLSQHSTATSGVRSATSSRSGCRRAIGCASGSRTAAAGSSYTSYGTASPPSSTAATCR
jgi:integrase